jgi:hypothetical protein
VGSLACVLVYFFPLIIPHFFHRFLPQFESRIRGDLLLFLSFFVFNFFFFFGGGFAGWCSRFPPRFNPFLPPIFSFRRSLFPHRFLPYRSAAFFSSLLLLISVRIVTCVLAYLFIYCSGVLGSGFAGCETLAYVLISFPFHSSLIPSVDFSIASSPGRFLPHFWHLPACSFHLFIVFFAGVWWRVGFAGYERPACFLAFFFPSVTARYRPLPRC